MGKMNKQAALRGLAVVLAAGVLGAGGILGWRWLFYRPYRVYEDCRGRGIDVERMKLWEDRAKDGTLGIVRIAGWRTGTTETVISISTGRRSQVKVTWVYGPMELAAEEKLLWGRFGLAQEGDYCVISEELARNLFGSVDVIGECLKTEDRRLAVAGVMKKEGEAILVSAAEGEVEYLSVEFDSRIGAEGKMRRLLEEQV